MALAFCKEDQAALRGTGWARQPGAGHAEVGAVRVQNGGLARADRGGRVSGTERQADPQASAVDASVNPEPTHAGGGCLGDSERWDGAAWEAGECASQRAAWPPTAVFAGGSIAGAVVGGGRACPRPVTCSWPPSAGSRAMFWVPSCPGLSRLWLQLSATGHVSTLGALGVLPQIPRGNPHFLFRQSPIPRFCMRLTEPRRLGDPFFLLSFEPRAYLRTRQMLLKRRMLAAPQSRRTRTSGGWSSV